MDESCILEPAKLTTVAGVLRMPPRGRPVELPRRLGNGPRESPPPRGGPGVIPFGSSSAWRPIGAQMAGGVAPVGGFEQPADGSLNRIWFGPAAARLLTDEELAAVFCRMFALSAGTFPIVLNVDVPDRALTAAFQAAGAALAAIYLRCPGPDDAPEHQAAIREAIGFAIKAVLLADQYRGRAFP